MYKKFLNAILFGALILGSAGTITSCKDYDDEIDEINQRISGLSGLSDQLGTLTSQLSTAASEAAAAKSSATSALENANKALEAAGVAADEAAKAAANEAIAAANAAAAAADAATAATDLKAAQAAAAAAAEAAKAAQKAAEEAAKATSQDDLAATVAKAAKDAAFAAEKVAAIESLQKEVTQLKNKIDSAPKGVSEDTMKTEVEKLIAKAIAVLGHRLQSLAVIPTAHVNGIAAITVTTLQYVPQKYQALTPPHEGLQEGHKSRPVLDHVSKAKAKTFYISSEKNEAYYHISPNNGVQHDDIELPFFESITSNNVTRADVDGQKVKANDPLVTTDWKIDDNVLTVTFKKKDNNLIGYNGEPHNEVANTVDKRTDKEYFTMVSLKAPIAEKNLTPEEIEKKEKAYVNSEYVRVEELIKVPYIAHNKADFKKVIAENMFADETQATKDPQVGTLVGGKPALYVHYHDSICAYTSKYDEYVDILAPYNETLDLTKWVTVCLTDPVDKVVFNPNHMNHEQLTNYSDYGLEFRFFLAGYDPQKDKVIAPYYTLGGPDENSNKTDQQQFAEVSKDGQMKSKVYTINGVKQTSIGREPLVRVELWDKNNNNLIGIRYIKVKWVKEVEKTTIKYPFVGGLYACGPFQSLIGTQEMNEQIYAQANSDKPGEGLSKATFHATYPDPTPDANGRLIFTEGSDDWGTVELIRNNENNVESYNILWTISHYDIVKKIAKDYKGDWEVWRRSGKPLHFEKTFYWRSATANTLEIVLSRDLYQEQFDLWGYDGRYWRNTDYKVFNVNPVVFDTQEPNPAWNIPTNVSWKTPENMNNPTNNIYTDLLNGFVDDLYKKPTTGADGALYFGTPVNGLRNDIVRFDDKHQVTKTSAFVYESGKRYYYAEDYFGTAKGSRGVKRGDYASFFKEGVRFTYDESKLNDAEHTYYYYDKASNSYKKGWAYTVNNDTKEPELWISASKTDKKSFNEKAATIVNYEPNLVVNPDIPQPELTYNIKLEEDTPDHEPFAGPQPTEAAKALVGQLVPIKLVGNLCEDVIDVPSDVPADNYELNTKHPVNTKNAHIVVIKAYDAFIIEPLKPKDAKTEDFTDATIGGSTIGVEDANIYESWNADEFNNYYPVIDPNAANVAALQAYIVKLYKSYKKDGKRIYSDAKAEEMAELAKLLGYYYEATEALWDTDNIKTNLAPDKDGNLVPTEGVKNGPLPSNTKVVYDPAEQTLTYHNYSGTPVNWNYKMYIPVTYGYKWKTQVNHLEVNVISNQGTDDVNK